jgi:Ca2+-binding RTX toxin-like protein
LVTQSDGGRQEAELTILSGAQGGPLKFSTLIVSDFFKRTSAETSPTVATYTLDSGTFTRLEGEDLAYNGQNNPVSGTATKLQYTSGGTLTFSLAGMAVSAATLFTLAKSGDTEGFLGLVLAGDDTVLGTAFADQLQGLGGSDLIRGRAGKDTLDGGAGNDTLDGGAGADRLVGGSGLDIASYKNAESGLTVSLSSLSQRTGEAKGDSFSSIEGLTGSDFADRLTGNAGNNVRNGGSGSDALFALSGKDTVSGGGGSDTITGGALSDRLSGGAGADFFVYEKISDSGSGSSTRDVISDFTPGTDVIDLSAIDANADVAGSAFSFIGGAAFSGPGQVRAVQTGPHTLLEMNTSGTSGASMSILLENVLAGSITSQDFIL